MLTEAFRLLSPILVARHQEMLGRELADSPELTALHDAYAEYTVRDQHLPRPVLAYFGYHALSDTVSFDDVDLIGDGLLVPQLLRDVLAIHDDIVDEDVEKFGAPPLPVVLSRARGDLTQRGKDLGLYYADLLIGVLLRLAARPGGDTAHRLTKLIAETLYVNQRGQLAELIAEDQPLTAMATDDLLLIGERKAAYYCYAFPFAVGAAMAGHAPTVIEPAIRLLVRIGTASQVVDDMTGTWPGVIDTDKDTLGEIRHLRRTVPLVLLAQDPATPATVRELLDTAPPLSDIDARVLRDALWNSPVPMKAVVLCRRLLAEITPQLGPIGLGEAASTYVCDLVAYRLSASVDRLERALMQ